MKTWHWWLFLLVCTGATAETLRLPFGIESSKLGVYVDGDYIRGPFGASLGTDGSLWVADSYKGRVAKYSRNGAYQGEIALEAISPRMTLFQRRQGGFVTLGDQTIAVWKDDGSLTVKTPLGLALPDQVWASANRVFAQFSQGSDSFCQSWDDTGAVTRSSLRRAGTEVAAIQDGRPWLTQWTDQKALFRWKAPVADDAVLAGWTPDGRSVWVERSERARAWWVRPDGTAAGPAAEFADVRAQGTAVSTTANLDLVVSRWRTDSLEVEILKAPK